MISEVYWALVASNFHLMNRILSKKAFTLVEMVVVVAILAILSLIGYVSYSDNVIGARDSQRTNDVEKLQIRS